VKVKLSLAQFTAVSAAAYQRAGKVELGLAAIEDAVQLFHLAERWCHSGILQLKGNMLMSSAPDQWAGAETCFHEAPQIAHHQEAKSPELRVATSVPRLRANRTGAPKRAICWRPFTTGSRRSIGEEHPIGNRPRALPSRDRSVEWRLRRDQYRGVRAAR